jgi:hypothetical protein
LKKEILEDLGEREVIQKLIVRKGILILLIQLKRIV